MVSDGIASLGRALAEGGVTSEELVARCLAAMERGRREGDPTMIAIQREEALAEARLHDQERGQGLGPAGPLSGLPVVIKDNMDQQGAPSLAGMSTGMPRALAGEDAAIVRKLRNAGAIVLGRTHMVELAYSGLGLNPHYGSPRNPFDSEHIVGGSSSGAAKAMAAGYAAFAIGTDTAGSVRVPAALCGIVGFKPTQARFSRDGVVPLAPSLDTVGTIGFSVACCATLDAVLADAPCAMATPSDPETTRLGIIASMVEGLDESTSRAWRLVVDRLLSAGIAIVPVEFTGYALMAEIAALGGVIEHEAAALYGDLLDRHGDLMDPRVASRLRSGLSRPGGDYAAILALRSRLIASFRAETRDVDAIVSPTVPLLAPSFAELEADAAYLDLNRKVLRNTLLANLVDGCSATVPFWGQGPLPMGVMLTARGGQDQRLLSCMLTVETILAQGGRFANSGDV